MERQQQQGYYKDGQPTDLWEKDSIFQSIPRYREQGVLNRDEVFGLLEPLVSKAADLGQYVPSRMPSITLMELGGSADEGAETLKRYRRNLPYFLSSPASMQDMFSHLRPRRTGSKMRDIFEVRPDEGSMVAQVIKYIAGEQAPPPVESEPIQDVATALYGKDQADSLKSQVADKQVK